MVVWNEEFNQSLYLDIINKKREIVSPQGMPPSCTCPCMFLLEFFSNLNHFLRNLIKVGYLSFEITPLSLKFVKDTYHRVVTAKYIVNNNKYQRSASFCTAQLC